MFGKYKKKYLELLVEHENMVTNFRAMLEVYHMVVKQRDALVRGEVRNVVNANKALTPEEIDRLIRLCHPDKHGNSKAATEMTQKLLAMR